MYNLTISKLHRSAGSRWGVDLRPYSTVVRAFGRVLRITHIPF